MEYFVKQSYGRLWHFYKNRHGLCFCIMNSELLREYQVLLPDGQEDFDVTIDDADGVHLVCQNENGDILYLNCCHDSWQKTVLLQSRTAGAYRKDFSLRRVNNWLNLFYTINHNGKKMLVHHIINSEEQPHAVDYIMGEFCTAQDSGGNLYVLFYSESKSSWGYARYVWSRKQWDGFRALEPGAGFCSPYIAVDDADAVHITGEAGGKIIHIADGMREELGEGTRPVLLWRDGLCVMWENIYDNKIYLKRAGEEKPVTFASGGFAHPKLFGVRYTCFESGYRAERCYGCIDDGAARLYHLPDFFAVSSAPPKPVRQSAAPEPDAERAVPDRQPDGLFLEVQKIKIQLSQISGTLEKLQNRLEGMDPKQINHRLEEIETVVNKLSSTKLWRLF